MKKILSLFFCFAVLGVFLGSNVAYSQSRTEFFHPFFKGKLNGKILILKPETEPKGDVIFVTGYYDRPDNHIPLFTEWTEKGFRVISFALPSHDENSGPYDFLSAHNFSTIYKMLLETERVTREDPNRPLSLAGWSLGGEVVTRFVQSGKARKLPRPVDSMVLIAPSVVVRPIVGEWGFATRRTLTHHPDYPFGGPLKPRSPYFHLPFTMSVVCNSALSFCQRIPKDIPTLVQTAGHDKYVSTRGVQRWVKNQRRKGADITYENYPNALHMLDAEERKVIEQAGDFLNRHCKGTRVTERR